MMSQMRGLRPVFYNTGRTQMRERAPRPLIYEREDHVKEVLGRGVSSAF